MDSPRVVGYPVDPSPYVGVQYRLPPSSHSVSRMTAASIWSDVANSGRFGIANLLGRTNNTWTSSLGLSQDPTHHIGQSRGPRRPPARRYSHRPFSRRLCNLADSETRWEEIQAARCCLSALRLEVVLIWGTALRYQERWQPFSKAVEGNCQSMGNISPAGLGRE